MTKINDIESGVYMCMGRGLDMCIGRGVFVWGGVWGGCVCVRA